MEFSKQPYFMTNPEWYTAADILNDGFPDDDRGYHLTDRAPKEAIDSYNEFYDLIERGAETPRGRARP